MKDDQQKVDAVLLRQRETLRPLRPLRLIIVLNMVNGRRSKAAKGICVQDALRTKISLSVPFVD